MTNFTRNKYVVGAIVERGTQIAIITKASLFGETKHYRLSLQFLGIQPSIYYCVSDGWFVVGEISPLMKELF